MRLVIEKTAGDVGIWAAKYIKKRINDFKPGPDKYFTLGLPTGNLVFHDNWYWEVKVLNGSKCYWIKKQIDPLLIQYVIYTLETI